MPMASTAPDRPLRTMPRRCDGRSGSSVGMRSVISGRSDLTEVLDQATPAGEGALEARRTFFAIALLRDVAPVV